MFEEEKGGNDMKMKNEERTRRNSTRIIAAVLFTVTMIVMLSSQVDASRKPRTKKVPLKKIELNVHKVTLNKGSKKTVKVKFFPKKAAAKKKVKWKSSKKRIASVKKGVITAKRPGKAVICAKIGKRSAKCTVVVTSPLKGIKLNKTEIELKKGSSFKLTVSYNPCSTKSSASSAHYKCAMSSLNSNHDFGVLNISIGKDSGKEYEVHSIAAFW